MELEVFVMDIQRFRSLAGIYGAAFERWPEAERAPAQALMACSVEARRLIENERELDDLIEQGLTLRADRLALSSAAERVASGVMETIRLSEAEKHTRPSNDSQSWSLLRKFGALFLDRFEWRYATLGLCTISGLGGVWLGLERPDHVIDGATMAMLNAALSGGGL